MTRLLKILSLGLFLILSGCESEENTGGTTTGNPQIVKVELRFDSYTAYHHIPILDYIIPTAHAGVNTLSFCFKRLRFKKADTSTSDPDNSEDNIDFEVGEIDLTNAGTLLGEIELEEGTYKRLEFDLNDNCSSGLSVDLNNDNSDFTSTDRITIKFSGTFTASGSNKTLSLGVQHIIDALGSYNGSPSLKDKLEGLSGSL